MADIRSGRALVELSALLNNGGDRVTLHLDAEPERDRFDVDARVISLDGRQVIASRQVERCGHLDDALALGHAVAGELLAGGAGPILAALRTPALEVRA